MNRIISAFAFASSLGLAACATSNPQAPGAVSATVKGVSAAPTAFSVQVVGHGPPVVLIPGLATSGQTWSGVVDHLKDRYTCHVLTLAGFAGVPAIDGRLLPQVHDQLVRYLEQNHLEHPVLLGHSLGGFTALWLAETNPELPSKVIVVDAFPSYSAAVMPGMSEESVKAQANEIREKMATLTPDQYRAQNLGALRRMMHSEKDVEATAVLSGKSDPRSVADAMAFVMTTDLRKDLAKVSAPILVLGEWGMYGSYSNEEVIRRQFEAQYAAAPHHQIDMVKDASHFIFLDQPQVFAAKVDAFLAGSVSAPGTAAAASR